MANESSANVKVGNHSGMRDAARRRGRFYPLWRRALTA